MIDNLSIAIYNYIIFSRWDIAAEVCEMVN